MKIIVKSRCFVKGKLLEPGKDGAPVEVEAAIAAAAITCGRATKAADSKKASANSGASK